MTYISLIGINKKYNILGDENEKRTARHRILRRSQLVAISVGPSWRESHSLKQITIVWKSTGTSDLANFWAGAAEQQEVVGTDTKLRGYGTSHFGNGDVANFVYEGTAKVTPKDAGAFDEEAQGTRSWLGGTGKHDVKGGGHLYLQV